MKKNLAARLGVLALVLTLVTSSLVSGTYSKYVTLTTGTDSTRVAKFAFNLTSLNTKSGSVASAPITQTTTTGTYDIFSYTDAGVYTNGLNGTAKFIAPGTTGTLTITVSNLSEVAVIPSFNIAETSNTNNIPLYYTIGAAPQRYSAVMATKAYPSSGTYSDLTAMGTAMTAAMSKIAATNGSTAAMGTLTLNWCWAFDTTTSGATSGQTDALDTALGTAGTAPTVGLSIAATVTQSDT